MNFSVIIPVFHEQETINDLLEHLMDLPGHERAEFIVVDGDPGGSTLDNMADFSEVNTLIGPKGRAAQMNAGAERAGNDILIFLHADTKLPDDAFRLIENAFRQKDVVGGAFQLSIDSDRPYLKLVSWMANRRTALNRIPYGDQAIFMDREYFNSIGGYREMPLMEEVELMRRIRKRGDSIAIIEEPVKTSDRRWEDEGAYYVTFRNWTLAVLYSLGVSPEFLVKFYKFGNRKHKNSRRFFSFLFSD
jgi:rSAM/selenodomain-associated transferase 2